MKSCWEQELHAWLSRCPWELTVHWGWDWLGRAHRRGDLHKGLLLGYCILRLCLGGGKRLRKIKWIPQGDTASKMQCLAQSSSISDSLTPPGHAFLISWRFSTMMSNLGEMVWLQGHRAQNEYLVKGWSGVSSMKKDKLGLWCHSGEQLIKVAHFQMKLSGQKRPSSEPLEWEHWLQDQRLPEK